MKKLKLLLLATAFPIAAAAQTLSLDECQRLAEENYPAVKQYALIEQTADLNVKNIKKGWLPQVQAFGQATVQTDVMTLPDPLQKMLAQQGYEYEGLKKDQYKIGAEINQTIWDGGIIKAQKNIALAQSQILTAKTKAEVSQIKQRVNDLYFSALLIDEKIKLCGELVTLLDSNRVKLEKMHRGGLVTGGDVLSIKAELTSAERQQIELTSAKRQILKVLAAFTGQENIDSLIIPGDIAPATGCHRTELEIFDAQNLLYDSQESILKAKKMPKIGAFAQGYYGYPGLNMFEDMFSHDFTLNGIIGARISWNIGSLYTNKNDRQNIAIQRDVAQSQRETFLFNNNLQQVKQNESIARYDQLFDKDNEVIAIRRDIRKAAEAKLQKGVIDVNTLLQEITKENQALLDLSAHKIERLNELYNLKLTTDNY